MASRIDGTTPSRQAVLAARQLAASTALIEVRMAKIVALLQGKGGTAKTTTAINLAGAFLEMNYRVAVADMDPQQSALAWPADDSVLMGHIHAMTPDNAKAVSAELQAQADIVIIDTPPTLSTREPMIAAHLADLLIVPCLAGAQEYQRADKTLRAVELFEKPYRLLASMIDLRERISVDAVATLKERGPVFETAIRRAVAIREAGFTGQWIGEYAAETIGHHQFRKLALEVAHILEINHA